MKEIHRRDILKSLSEQSATSSDALATQLGKYRASVKNALLTLKRYGFVSQDRAGWHITNAGKQELDGGNVARKRILQLVGNIHDIARNNDIAYVFGMDINESVYTRSNTPEGCHAEIRRANEALTGEED